MRDPSLLTTPELKSEITRSRRWASGLLIPVALGVGATLGSGAYDMYQMANGEYSQPHSSLQNDMELTAYLLGGTILALGRGQRFNHQANLLQAELLSRGEQPQVER